MKKFEKALVTTTIVSIGGMLFSGFLTVQKLLTSTCVLGEACQQIGPLPACAYGLIMYTIILAASVYGLKSKEAAL